MKYIIKGYYVDSEGFFKTDVIAKSNYPIDIFKLKEIVNYHSVSVYGKTNDNQTVLLDNFIVGELVDYEDIADQLHSLSGFKHMSRQELMANQYVVAVDGTIKMLGFNDKYISVRELLKNTENLNNL